MTRFSKLEIGLGLGGDAEVTETNVREIKQSDIKMCPHFILVAEHYREDGTCKCDDPAETVMNEWGYTWRDGQWR